MLKILVAFFLSLLLCRLNNQSPKGALPCVACAASVSARVRRESLGREQKIKGMTRDGEGKAFPLLPSPSPCYPFFLLPLSNFCALIRLETLAFFCSRSNFRALTRLETLAMQAIPCVVSLVSSFSTSSSGSVISF